MGDFYDDMNCAAGCDGGPMGPSSGEVRAKARARQDADAWKARAEALWQLLDDIDTGSDMFKPHDEKSYKAFYEYAMARAERRHKYLHSPDGYKLVVTEEK